MLVVQIKISKKHNKWAIFKAILIIHLLKELEVYIDL